MSERGSRRRLSVDQRRAELLRIGMELFSTRAYEEIWVEEIAELAGISRGLLYHYFPTKRDFYVAVSRAAAAQRCATGRTRARDDRFTRAAPEPRPSSRHLHAGHRLASRQAPARLIPDRALGPGFDVIHRTFSTRHQWFACARLLGPHLP